MLIVIFVVCLIAIFVGAWLYDNWEHEYVGATMVIISSIIVLFAFVFLIMSICNVAGAYVIDEKIQLYEDANAAIEERINDTVEDYKAYENDTLEKFDGHNGTEVVSLYPELKANELIQEQMEIYYQNQTTILGLKEEKINMKPWQWWLYFGG